MKLPVPTLDCVGTDSFLRTNGLIAVYIYYIILNKRNVVSGPIVPDCV